MFFRVLCIAVALFGLGCSGKFTRAPTSISDCPIVGQGEAALDCPWAGIARMMQREPQAAVGILEQEAPAVFAAMRRDAENQDLLSFWGESLNFDEAARSVIVGDAVIRGFSELSGVRPPRGENGKTVHAGVEHTYGYLFSTLKTPFGFKRARWVEGEMERGFGVSAGTFGPKSQEGTLLSNVTYFFGKIAFRRSSRHEDELESRYEGSRELRTFPFSELKVSRIEETATLEGPRQVTLRTDLVEFLREGAGKRLLLVYSVEDSARPGPRLITGFPVDFAFAQKLLAGNGGTVAPWPVTPRYNAYVEGLSGLPRPRMGTRKVLK